MFGAEADTAWWADEMNRTMGWPHILTVFFVESAASATIDLRGTRGQQKWVAVDSKAEYKEINKGNLAAGVHTVQLGKVSDWVFAIGDFDVQQGR
jgi:hypothetical protein